MAAASVASAVAGVVLWALDKWAFEGDTPDAFQVLVFVAVPGLVAFAAGWVARHTPRTDPDAVPGT